MAATDKDILNAIEAERTRCVELLECYRGEFEGTTFIHLWCRIRNQIAAGTDPAKSDFFSQFLESDDSEE